MDKKMDETGAPERDIQQTSKKTNIKIYSMSVPEDQSFSQGLDKHLSALQFGSSRLIELYGDYKILPGENIARYKQKILEADMVLVFVSVDFLISNDCYERLTKVIENYNNKKNILLPVLARNCIWTATPFAELLVLPKCHQPLNNRQYWNSEDDALTDVAKDIYSKINSFFEKSDANISPKQSKSVVILNAFWRRDYAWAVFRKRVAAFLLDQIIIGIPVLIVVGIMILHLGVSLPYALFLLVIADILMHAYMESSKWRGTPGKRIMKLQVTDDKGQPITFRKAVLRNGIKMLFFILATPLTNYLGLIYLPAQVFSYATTRKFFQDRVSNTVIGDTPDKTLSVKTEKNNLPVAPEKQPG